MSTSNSWMTINYLVCNQSAIAVVRKLVITAQLKIKPPTHHLGTSNNQPDAGWTIQKSKRNLSSSTNSEPNFPSLTSNEVQDSNQLKDQFNFSLNDSTENVTSNMQTDYTK
ncbi:hypothetical protein QTP88_005449 [Uroleucon formosanum]